MLLMSRRFDLRSHCFLWLLVFGGLTAPALAQPLVAPEEALSPAEQQKKFHLPPGFEIQLVASEPAIHKPMNISFDSQGRLWLTDTLEYPYPAKEGTTPRDTVKILTDTNGDGSADNIQTFVDGLNIPLGVMPVSDGVIVYGIPAVMKCRDTDGDGKADTRETLYGNFGNRDTHGMVNSFTRGLDGWLYACHGFNNDSTPVGSDGQQITLNSGNTIRMRLDGSHIEYNTHGQVNPFGLCFDPLGNLYSADCHTMPVYTLLRGAYYPSFGKPHDGLDFGPTMIGHNHKSTGIGGIAYYAADHFPPEYRDTLFIGNPVTGCVNHDRLTKHGSTYDCVELPDFITCDDLWFRPVNIQVGPDGALYIADFYNCIIGHYEVPLTHPRRDRERGRLWRVVYTGKGVEKPAATAPAEAPNVHAASLESLVELLSHANLTVRTLATHELVDRIGKPAIEPLVKAVSDEQASSFDKIHGLWAIERLGGLNPAVVEKLAADADPGVRVHVMKMLAERANDDSVLTRKAIADEDPFVKRAAADALGRHPHHENVRLLADLWGATDAKDTHLIHVTRMALRDQLLAEGVYDEAKKLAESDPALAERLANVSLGVPNAASARFVLWHLEKNPATTARDAYLHHVTRHIADGDLNQVYQFADRYRSLSPLEQVGVVRALGRGLQERGATSPDQLNAWIGEITGKLLASEDENQVRAGIDMARDFRPQVLDVLAGAAGPAARFAGLRTAAMDACAGYEPARAVPLLAAVLHGGAEPLNVRQHAAAALARINDDAARGQLLTCLQTAPEGLALAVAAGLSDTPAGAEALLATVTEGKASARLLQQGDVVNRLKARNLKDLDARLEALTAKLPPADQRINELMTKRREVFSAGQPDLAKGAAVFEKNCALCHRIGDKGAKVGPNLDGVGIRGVERLLEDVLDPSRNVDQAFRTTQVVTADGRNLTGLALREEGNILVLADAQGKEVRVPIDEIEERVISPLSVMPANVPDLVSEADFVHLLGYLLSQRVEQAAK
jgi:putative heme-binding domain-containing protein